LRNIALKLKYRGSAYHGWQSQKNAICVQDVLSQAIRKLTGEPPYPYLEGCGRTDAGVHALSYVASFKTNSTIQTERLAPALNSLLPDDIAVFSAHEVPEEFHARFSCLKKEYVYKIYDSYSRNPFFSELAYHHSYPLDEKKMAEAAAYFIGEHDFSAFRAAGSKVKGSVRTMYHSSVEREGDLLRMTFCANGFLYNMVRILAGTLVYISEGKISVSDLPGILEGKNRQSAGVTLPACGLYLNRVWYGEDCVSDR
jgi:tRNA pseudouridine38-40 synthase